MKRPEVKPNICIRFQENAVMSRNVRALYDSLGLDHGKWLENQRFELESDALVSFIPSLTYKRDPLKVAIPEKLKKASEWVCHMEDLDGALLLSVCGFPWIAFVRSLSRSQEIIANLPDELFYLSLPDSPLPDLAVLNKFSGLAGLNVGRCESLRSLKAICSLLTLQSLDFRGGGNISDLQPLQRLPELRSFRMGAHKWALRDIDALGRVQTLTHLCLLGCHQLENLSPLRGLPNLRSLGLPGATALTDLDPLKELTNLRSLDLSYCKSLRNLGPLETLPNLEELFVRGCGSLDSLSPLSKLTSLTTLGASECAMLSDLKPLNGLIGLRALDLSGLDSLEDVSSLRCLTKLTELNLSACCGLSDLSALSGLASLKDLKLGGSEALKDLGPLGGLDQLVRLGITDCGSLSDLDPLASLQRVDILNLSGCRSLRQLGPIGKMQNLSDLDLGGCELIEQVAALGDLSRLKHLSLFGCRSLRNLEGLQGLDNLTDLSLDNCELLSDVGALKFLPRLRSLNLAGCLRLRTPGQLRGSASVEKIFHANFHPAELAELLAHAAWLRRDYTYISDNSAGLLSEFSNWMDGPLALQDRFAVTLGKAFSLLGESDIDEAYEESIARRGDFSAAPWKAWFGGTLKESGFELYRRRVERVPLAEMTSGAIGGACLTLPLEEHLDWARQWLVELEKSCLGDAKTLLPVAPEICLACARSGDRPALKRWLEAFTDPSDVAALDPVHAALARFQIAGGDLPAAENHAHAIHSPAVRDLILCELVVRLSESDEDLASVSLLLIEDQALRIDLAKKLAAKAAASEVLIHRCIVAAGESSQAVADLISALPQSSRSELVVQLSKKLQTDRKTTLLGIADKLRRQADRLSAQALEVD